MNGRRSYGMIEKGLSTVIAQAAAGAWDHHTTDSLKRQVLRATRNKQLTADAFLATDPLIGDLHDFGMTELVLEKLRTVRMQIILPPTELYPDERPERVRVIHNVPTGKPLDPKRADDPNAFSKVGQWVPSKSLSMVQSQRTRAVFYLRRRHDAKPDEALLQAIENVLRRYGEQDRARDHWDEILAEMSRIMAA